MAYIGKSPTIGNFQKCDAISVVNGQATYGLTVNSVAVFPESSNHVLCSLNGILQAPQDSFTISSSNIVFASNLSTGDVIDFVMILGNVLDLGVPSDNTVSASKLTNDIISGQTALTSEPADTDEFLVSDAGTIKRIDYSLIKGGGITEADQYRLTANITADVSPISSNLERTDDASFAKIGTGMSVSSGTFTFPSTGLYLILTQMEGYSSASDNIILTVSATTNNSTYDQLSRVVINGVQSDCIQTGASIAFVNVTDTTNVKVRFTAQSISNGAIHGNTDSSRTAFTFIRMGDSQ